MINRRTKLRFRRVVRKRRKQVVGISSATEKTFDKHLFRRLIKLVEVRRFIFGWVGLLTILSTGVLLQTRALSSHYQSLSPVAGGTYREGMIGTFTNANPLYAQSSVDSSVSRLVFSSLLKYDESGKLIPELAESYSYNQSETVYTVKLKQGVAWQDGQPFTAKDVVFTYKSIQNPDVRSHLLSSWRGVAVEAIDEHTVTFTLPNALSAFPQSLTNGIIPEHILSRITPAQLRANSFNNELPIGTGPFKFRTVEVDDSSTSQKSERIGFVKNDSYFAGKPKLDRFAIRTFSDDNTMLDSFRNNQIDGMVGLTSNSDQKLGDAHQYGIPLASEVMVFFKNNQEVLKDPVVRSALVLAIDKKTTLASVGYPLMSVDEPLLRSHIGYDKRYGQQTGDMTKAKAMLDQAGWKVEAGGIRVKDGKRLSFKLTSGATGEYTAISANLQKQWHDLGVNLEVSLLSDQELQSTVSSHGYDSLLYGIAVGPDPDVYPYWHSTQADIRSDTRLNLSEYKSTVVDRALEAGRTRSDPQIRALKYRPFLEAWQKDAPALALYQPRFFYVSTSSLDGFHLKSATVATDRFIHVERWTVRKQAQNQN